MDDTPLIVQCVNMLTDLLGWSFEVQEVIWTAIGGITTVMMGFFAFHCLLRFYVQRLGGAFMQASSSDRASRGYDW